MMQKFLSIGKILNFHGIKGEVKVGFSEGNEKVFTEVKEVVAVKGPQQLKLSIESVRFHKQYALIKFKEINSIDEAMEVKGALLKVPKEQLEGYLEEDEFYISDLVGLKAFDGEGNLIGEVSGVVNLKGQDTLFVKDAANKEHMVPFNREFVPEVDLKGNRLVIRLIEGLI